MFSARLVCPVQLYRLLGPSRRVAANPLCKYVPHVFTRYTHSSNARCSARKRFGCEFHDFLTSHPLNPFIFWNCYICCVDIRHTNFKSQFSFFLRFRYFKNRISVTSTFTMLYSETSLKLVPSKCNYYPLTENLISTITVPVFPLLDRSTIVKR